MYLRFSALTRGALLTVCALSASLHAETVFDIKDAAAQSPFTDDASIILNGNINTEETPIELTFDGGTEFDVRLTSSSLQNRLEAVSDRLSVNGRNVTISNLGEILVGGIDVVAENDFIFEGGGNFEAWSGNITVRTGSLSMNAQYGDIRLNQVDMTLHDLSQIGASEGCAIILEMGTINFEGTDYSHMPLVFNEQVGQKGHIGLVDITIDGPGEGKEMHLRDGRLDMLHSTIHASSFHAMPEGTLHLGGGTNLILQGQGNYSVFGGDTVIGQRSSVRYEIDSQSGINDHAILLEGKVRAIADFRGGIAGSFLAPTIMVGGGTSFVTEGDFRDDGWAGDFPYLNGTAITLTALNIELSQGFNIDLNTTLVLNFEAGTTGAWNFRAMLGGFINLLDDDVDYTLDEWDVEREFTVVSIDMVTQLNGGFNGVTHNQTTPEGMWTLREDTMDGSFLYIAVWNPYGQQIPEPAAALMACAGIFGLAWRRRVSPCNR